MPRMLLKKDGIRRKPGRVVARASLPPRCKEALSVPMVTVAVPEAEIIDGEMEQSLAAKSDGAEQDNVTVPVKEFSGVTVRVVVALEGGSTVTEAGLTESRKSGMASVFCQSAARLNASTDPRPVTWSYPVPAE
jgi:hypothetical protein